MKNILYLALACLFIGCNNQPNEKKENSTAPTTITTPVTRIIPDFNIALKFINDYTGFCSRKMSVHSDTTEASWIQHNLLLTDNFKNRYKNILDAAKKADPELGLDFDPVLDAQDFPDKGFAISESDTANGYVTMTGIGQPDFKLVLKLTSQNNTWLVDGAGVINIPGDKRAKR